MQNIKNKLNKNIITNILIVLSIPLMVQVLYLVYKMGMIYGTIIRKLVCM